MDQTLSSSLDATSNIQRDETPVQDSRLTGHCKVARQYQCLQKDIDTTDLNRPPKLANEFLEVLYAVGFQLWRLFQRWSIIARERCYTLGWQPLAMLGQVLLNISDSCLYILFRQHSPAHLTVVSDIFVWEYPLLANDGYD
jgi:hypothetical protein